jgi:hypothetical protein
VQNKGSVIYNTTGFLRGKAAKKIIRCWTFPGIVRFNCAGFPEATHPLQLEYVSCISTGIEVYRGANRLLLQCKARPSASIDYYLVGVKSLDYGRISFAKTWRNKGVRIVASSSYAGEQETLLLVAPEGRFKTDGGIWKVVWVSKGRIKGRAHLEKVETFDGKETNK